MILLFPGPIEISDQEKLKKVTDKVAFFFEKF